jgi:hypothetical protein
MNASPATHCRQRRTIAAYTSCSGPAASFKSFADGGSHSEWIDGQVHQSGFTTAWRPNRATPGSLGARSAPDVDLVGVRESNGGSTYGALTARSFHPGGVHFLFGDGWPRSLRRTSTPMPGARSARPQVRNR